MPEVETKVAVLEAEHRAHVKSDDERYNRIDSNMEKIARDVASFGDRLEKGFTRVHERIDDEAGKARHNLANEVMKVQGLVRDESHRAQEAEGEIVAAATTLERGGRNYIEKGLMAALGAAGASIAYLAAQWLKLKGMV